MKPLLPLLILTLLLPALTAQETLTPENVSKHLARLTHDNAEIRIDALREIQTSLDPRLPDALLPLLQDDGNSIRRLAARAVGSRYWQISDERRPVFLKVLEGNLRSRNQAEKNMAARGIGLIKRKYDGSMFARSRSKRWVIYERRKLPCLIDTKTQSEELLGWVKDGHEWFGAAWSNGDLKGEALWHRRKDIVALHTTMGRKHSTIWVWEHKKGLRKFSMDVYLKVMGLLEAKIPPGAGFFVSLEDWQGDELRMRVQCSTVSGPDEEIYTDHAGLVAWHATTGTWRLLDMKPTRG